MIRSIRGRFLLVSLISVVAALSLAGLAFVQLFTATIEQRIDRELTGHGDALAGAIGFSAEGRLEIGERPMDPRFGEPYGGLYWQVVDDGNGAVLRSPSLWDYALPLPADRHEAGTVHRYHLPGPDGSTVLVQERGVILAAPDGERPVRIIVAIDLATLAEARATFAIDLLPYMVALAAFLVAASLAQLTIGLRPLSSVSEGLNRIRDRRAERLTGTYPDEMRGVVEAVNSLLDSQQRIIDRARGRAADLAHGLKTPLTVLANDAASLREKGEVEMGEELAHLADVMQAHVSRELTRSRIAASASLRQSDADLGDCVDKIVRTLKRTPKGEELGWRIAVPAVTMVEVDPHDLQELVGNILENAVKWAKTEIGVQARVLPDGHVALEIMDDGPGAEPDQLQRIMDRGVRLDMHTPGSGIGLSIVRDIAEVYGIQVRIANRPDGGLLLHLTF